MKMSSLIHESLFNSDNKMKPYEKLLSHAVVNFCKDEYDFDAKVIIKKKRNAALIGDISLSDASVNNHKFVVHYNPSQSYTQIIKSLIHELTHVKQVVKGELRPREDWKGIVWNDDYEISVKEYKKVMKDFSRYKQLPWEREAYSSMEPLKDKFLSSEYWEELRGKDPTLDFIIDNM